MRGGVNICFTFIIIIHHLSINREGRLGTTDDFATSFLHLSLFSTAPWNCFTLDYDKTNLSLVAINWKHSHICWRTKSLKGAFFPIERLTRFSDFIILKEKQPKKGLNLNYWCQIPEHVRSARGRSGTFTHSDTLSVKSVLWRTWAHWMWL